MKKVNVFFALMLCTFLIIISTSSVTYAAAPLTKVSVSVYRSTISPDDIMIDITETGVAASRSVTVTGVSVSPRLNFMESLPYNGSPTVTGTHLLYYSGCKVSNPLHKGKTITVTVKSYCKTTSKMVEGSKKYTIPMN